MMAQKVILDEPADQNDLEMAFSLLEHQSFAGKATKFIGLPMNKAMKLLPSGWHERIGHATEAALEKTLDFALMTMKNDGPGTASRRFHKILSGVTGAVGGAFGLAALAVELPVSLAVMLRSIADIARSEGEPLLDTRSRLACIEVLALGGIGEVTDPSKSGYYAVRLAMASAVTEAAKYVAEKGLIGEGAPALVRLLTQVSSRFTVQVSQKTAAQMIPVIGAAGGALINLLFIDHFQDLARGHFTVRRLERKYSPEKVREAYESLRPVEA